MNQTMTKKKNEHYVYDNVCFIFYLSSEDNPHGGFYKLIDGKLQWLYIVGYSDYIHLLIRPLCSAAVILFGCWVIVVVH